MGWKGNYVLGVVVAVTMIGCGGQAKSELEGSDRVVTSCPSGETFISSATVYPGNAKVSNVCITVTGGASCGSSGNYTITSGLDFCTSKSVPPGPDFAPTCVGNWDRYGITGLDPCGYIGGTCPGSKCTDGSCCPPNGICKNGIHCQL
jgi:hypothetical protein